MFKMKKIIKSFSTVHGVMLEKTSTVWRLNKEPSSLEKEGQRALPCPQTRQGRAKERKKGIGRKFSSHRFGERAPCACAPCLSASQDPSWS